MHFYLQCLAKYKNYYSTIVEVYTSILLMDVDGLDKMHFWVENNS